MKRLIVASDFHISFYRLKDVTVISRKFFKLT
jgi:hypothetical protein